MNIAFSYMGISSPETAKSGPFKRQSEKAEVWARANGYTIVRNWTDLAVSSARGGHAKTGHFAEFLQAVRDGELPKDSVLLVENLGRVSRQNPRKALAEFLEVIDMGIGVVTLTDSALHTAASSDGYASGMKLFASLMVMIHADNESRVRGERAAAAWSTRRGRSSARG